MACVAIMQRGWRCPDWTADGVKSPITASLQSRGPVVGHSMARMVPFGSRSSVGA
jgi:hypothetical protein